MLLCAKKGDVRFPLRLDHHLLLQTFMVSDTDIQSTLVISKSKGPSEALRDIRTSTYQIFRTEENTNCTTKFQK